MTEILMKDQHPEERTGDQVRRYFMQPWFELFDKMLSVCPHHAPVDFLAGMV
jgi:hypothetical protein